MRALLRRDRKWLTVLLALGGAALAVAFNEVGFVHLWVLPADRCDEPFHTGWIIGAVVGLGAALWDDVLGLRELVRHRPMSPRRLYAARLLGCARTLAGCIVLAALAHWLWEGLRGTASHEWRLGAVPRALLPLLPMASSCALWWFAGTRPCAHWMRLCFGGALLFASFTLIDAVARGGESTHDLTIFALAHTGLAVVFVAASFVGAGTAADPDRPWPTPVLRWSAIPGAFGLAISGALLFGAWERESLTSLIREYPRVVSIAGGEEHLAIPQRIDRETKWLPVGADHSVVGLPREGTVVLMFTVPDEVGRCDPGFGAPQTGRSWRSHQLLNDGLVWLLAFQPEELHVIGKGAQRERFARDAVLVYGGSKQEQLWVAEPGSAVVWRIDTEADRSIPVPLPNGDRLVRVHSVPVPADHQREWHLFRWSALVGERSVYVAGTDAITPAPEWMVAGVRSAEVAPQAASLLQFLDRDPFAYHVRKVGDDGEVLWEHVFAPRRFEEIRHAVAAVCWSMVRTPLFQVPSFFTSQVPGHDDPVRDRLLVGQRHLWLLLLCIACALASAVAVHRRLRRLGAHVVTRRLWTVLVLLLGPLGLAASVMCERRRAYLVPAAEDAPLPRIASPRLPPARAV
jgi:hypothetical protein